MDITQTMNVTHAMDVTSQQMDFTAVKAAGVTAKDGTPTDVTAQMSRQ